MVIPQAQTGVSLAWTVVHLCLATQAQQKQRKLNVCISVLTIPRRSGNNSPTSTFSAVVMPWYLLSISRNLVPCWIWQATWARGWLGLDFLGSGQSAPFSVQFVGSTTNDILVVRVGTPPPRTPLIGPLPSSKRSASGFLEYGSIYEGAGGRLVAGRRPTYWEVSGGAEP